MALPARRSPARRALGILLATTVVASPAYAAFGDAPPQLTKLSITPRAFKALAKGDATTEKGGGVVSFDLDASVDVALTFKRALGKRYVPVPGQIRLVGISDRNVLRISGRINGKALKPGLYRIVARPIAENAKAAFRGFHIIR